MHPAHVLANLARSTGTRRTGVAQEDFLQSAVGIYSLKTRQVVYHVTTRIVVITVE
jgi:hypothetical protein